MKLPVDPVIVDITILGIGLLVAVAAVVLQWSHFKKHNPLSQKSDPTQISAYNRWKITYWREVRATFALALISLVMLGLVVLGHRELTVMSVLSIGFWLGMFFYNLWVAQWYAWRIQNKRRR